MPEESNRSAARRSESTRKTPLSRVFPKNPRAHLAPSVVISPAKLHISKDLNKTHEPFARTEQTSGNTPISNKMLHSRVKERGVCEHSPKRCAACVPKARASSVDTLRSTTVPPPQPCEARGPRPSDKCIPRCKADAPLSTNPYPFVD